MTTNLINSKTTGRRPPPKRDERHHNQSPSNARAGSLRTSSCVCSRTRHRRTQASISPHPHCIDLLPQTVAFGSHLIELAPYGLHFHQLVCHPVSLVAQ